MQSTITIEDATECLIDYRGKTPPKSSSGVRLITAKVVKNGQITDEYKEFIAEDFYHKWMRRGLPKKNDVLITTEAPLGEVAMLRANERIALAQRIILLRAKRSVLESAYLFYALQSEFCQNELKARGSGTTVHGIKQSELRKVRIPYVSLPQQRKIAGVLSAYDSLIENNQRRIEILREMAHLVYREWFEEFRFPGHESANFRASPLGRIPEGWQVQKLGEVACLHYGKALKKEDRRTGPISVFGSSGVVGFHDVSLTDGPGIIIGRKGNVGSVFWSDSDFFVIDTAYYVSSDLPLRYLYHLLPTLNFINGDAAVPGLSRSQAYSLKIIVPDRGTLEKFCAIADSFGRQASVLHDQIIKLQRARDLLIPRLLSGQINLDLC